MIAKDLASNILPFLKTTDKVSLGLSLMADYMVLHLPVLDEEKQLLGIIDYQNLFDAPKNATIKTFQNKIVALEINEDQPIYKVLSIINTYKLTILPVISENLETDYKTISIFDVIKFISKSTALEHNGGLIVLEMPITNYSLSEIARLAESNNATILSVFTSSPSNYQLIDVYIKLNIIDLTHVIATYERFGYEIKAVFHESEITDIYKDRYDQLMNYLNI